MSSFNGNILYVPYQKHENECLYTKVSVYDLVSLIICHRTITRKSQSIISRGISKPIKPRLEGIIVLAISSIDILEFGICKPSIFTKTSIRYFFSVVLCLPVRILYE